MGIFFTSKIFLGSRRRGGGDDAGRSPRGEEVGQRIRGVGGRGWTRGRKEGKRCETTGTKPAYMYIHLRTCVEGNMANYG